MSTTLPPTSTPNPSTPSPSIVAPPKIVDNQGKGCVASVSRTGARLQGYAKPLLSYSVEPGNNRSYLARAKAILEQGGLSTSSRIEAYLLLEHVLTDVQKRRGDSLDSTTVHTGVNAGITLGNLLSKPFKDIQGNEIFPNAKERLEKMLEGYKLAAVLGDDKYGNANYYLGRHYFSAAIEAQDQNLEKNDLVTKATEYLTKSQLIATKKYKNSKDIRTVFYLKVLELSGQLTKKPSDYWGSLVDFYKDNTEWESYLFELRQSMPEAEIPGTNEVETLENIVRHYQKLANKNPRYKPRLNKFKVMLAGHLKHTKPKQARTLLLEGENKQSLRFWEGVHGFMKEAQAPSLPFTMTEVENARALLKGEHVADMFFQDLMPLDDLGIKRQITANTEAWQAMRKEVYVDAAKFRQPRNFIFKPHSSKGKNASSTNEKKQKLNHHVWAKIGLNTDIIENALGKFPDRVVGVLHHTISPFGNFDLGAVAFINARLNLINVTFAIVENIAGITKAIFEVKEAIYEIPRAGHSTISTELEDCAAKCVEHATTLDRISTNIVGEALCSQLYSIVLNMQEIGAVDDDITQKNWENLKIYSNMLNTCKEDDMSNSITTLTLSIKTLIADNNTTPLPNQEIRCQILHILKIHDELSQWDPSLDDTLKAFDSTTRILIKSQYRIGEFQRQYAKQSTNLKEDIDAFRGVLKKYNLNPQFVNEKGVKAQLNRLRLATVVRVSLSSAVIVNNLCNLCEIVPSAVHLLMPVAGTAISLSGFSTAIAGVNVTVQFLDVCASLYEVVSAYKKDKKITLGLEEAIRKDDAELISLATTLRHTTKVSKIWAKLRATSSGFSLGNYGLLLLGGSLTLAGILALGPLATPALSIAGVVFLCISGTLGAIGAFISASYVTYRFSVWFKRTKRVKILKAAAEGERTAQTRVQQDFGKKHPQLVEMNSDEIADFSAEQLVGMSGKCAIYVLLRRLQRESYRIPPEEINMQDLHSYRYLRTFLDHEKILLLMQMDVGEAVNTIAKRISIKTHTSIKTSA